MRILWERDAPQHVAVSVDVPRPRRAATLEAVVRVAAAVAEALHAGNGAPNTTDAVDGPSTLRPDDRGPMDRPRVLAPPLVDGG